MAAVACLRVLLDGNRTDVPPERLGPLVAKYATCFLEVRWTFPRVSKSLSHYSYLLTDPTALELDTVELAHLSQDLQTRLFGTGVEDAVTLVLFEGDAQAIAAFAGYSADEVRAAMDDPSALPSGGRLRRIAADGSLVDVPEAASSPAAAQALRFGSTVDGAQGIYFAPGGAFIGDVVSCTPACEPTYYSMVEGLEHRPGPRGGCRIFPASRTILARKIWIIPASSGTGNQAFEGWRRFLVKAPVRVLIRSLSLPPTAGRSRRARGRSPHRRLEPRGRYRRRSAELRPGGQQKMIDTQ
ncbi:hypothetical protein [Brevundimonas sp.]|uniref:hypothetical protein n=1 Tax=Brevundimonas sp. TaxID=1871086 RepID=UPI003BAAAF4C